MNQIVIKTPAKINYTLDVTGKREDGYHLLSSVFQTVSIYDYITITYQNSCNAEFSISCTKPYIPCNKKNICYKAGNILEQYLKKSFMENIHINIEKNIPSQAGMGGGSSDAAAVILGLIRLFDFKISDDEIIKLASKVGADVPFFFFGGTAYAEGIGDILNKVENKHKKISLVIVKPRAGISTVAAYGAVDNLKNPIHPDSDKLIKALSGDNLLDIAGNCANIFTKAAKISDVDRAISDLKSNGALNAEMTGSGSAVFGIFENEKKAEICYKKLKNAYDYVKVCFASDIKMKVI
jgi:4-diphosphocytidyl-2-C-methyl-D-erythritol kinase